MRGSLCRINHSRLDPLDALSTLLDWKDSSGSGEGMSPNENIAAGCHARTTIYPRVARQFLEAVLNIPEKLTALAQKVVGNLNARRCNGCRPATEMALAACEWLNSDET
jgi:hypothetical protein